MRSRSSFKENIRALTGNSVRLSAKGQPQILVPKAPPSCSNFRSGIPTLHNLRNEVRSNLQPSEDTERDVTRKFLEQFSDKRPSNDTRGTEQ